MARRRKQVTDDRSLYYAGIIGCVFLGAIFLICTGIVFNSFFGSGTAKEKFFPDDSGLSIEVEDNVDVYIGEDFVGRGSVFMTWEAIIGTESNSSRGKLLAPDTSEREIQSFVSGQHSIEVWSNTDSTEYDGPFTFKFDMILSRRSDGQLDQVCIIDLALEDGDGGMIHVVVPVRLRSSSHFFASAPVFETEKREDSSGETIIDTTISFQDVATPEEFAEEVKRNGLWSPRE